MKARGSAAHTYMAPALARRTLIIEEKRGWHGEQRLQIPKNSLAI